MSPTKIKLGDLNYNLEPQSLWRSMLFFNFYRCIIACAFFAYYFLPRSDSFILNFEAELYFHLAIIYMVISLVGFLIAWFQKLALKYQLTIFTIADIVLIVSLTYAAGGLKTGLGVLLVIAISLASLFSKGRLALFYAALASIALLLEQSYQVLTWNDSVGDYSHAVILSVSCFATAWLAHSLAKRSLQSEALASQRGLDLENMAQINALITQDMQDGVLVVDKEFVVRHHNTQAEDLLSVTSEAWQAKSLFICSPELAKLMQQWVHETPFPDTSQAPCRLRISSRELRLRFMPIATDRSEGAVIFIEDWSQIQTQAQQVKLAALGRLTANIAHEIRNPLSAISHATELLQEENFEATNKRMLEIIAVNVQRLDQIVKDVLELNRRDRTHQETIDLAAFLSDFREQFCQAEKIAPSSFALNLGKKNISISFDKRHLNQILWNLCRNAWRHSQQKNSSVMINVSSHSHASKKMDVSLEVSDDGSGVAAQAIPHLFEPFFTTESTGTGLGLYIARELCQANGTLIQYETSERGASFTIHLKKALV